MATFEQECTQDTSPDRPKEADTIRVSAAYDTLPGAPEEVAATPAPQSVPQQLVQLCAHLGMTPVAAESLAASYTKPVVMWVSVPLALLMGHTAYAILYLGGFPWPTWRAVIPECVFICSGILHGGGFYLRGPAYAKLPYMASVSAAVAPILAYLSMTPFVGTLEFVPFGSRVIATAGIAVGAFGVVFISKACDTGENCAKLRPRLVLAQTAMTTLRSVNNLTDFGLIRVIVSEIRQQRCYWFGDRVTCARSVAMAVTAGIFPGAIMLKEIVLGLYPPVSCGAATGKRLELISRVVTLACLLGEVVLNSLKLFSDATTSSRFAEAGLDNTTFQRDVAFTFVSCGLSIATLIMAAVGFRRVLQAVRSTAQRISTRAGSAASTVRRRASNVGASIVVGIRGSTVQPGRGGTHVVAGPELEADTTPARMERARVAWT